MRLDHLFSSGLNARSIHKKKDKLVNSNNISTCSNSTSCVCRSIPHPQSCFFLHILFPVSTAGLQLTFPSRTRSIRGLTTMVLHNRVRESSSTPGFFLSFVSSFNSLLTVLHILFPVSTAGLQLTFPSRTRLIRGLTTMVLHNRVRESSSTPGFFCF